MDVLNPFAWDMSTMSIKVGHQLSLFLSVPIRLWSTLFQPMSRTSSHHRSSVSSEKTTMALGATSTPCSRARRDRMDFTVGR